VRRTLIVRTGLALAWAALSLAAASLPVPGGAAAAVAAGEPAGALPRIAVLNLQGVGAGQEEAIALTEGLREALLKTGRFLLVDRRQTERVLAEQAAQQAACTEPDCVRAVGRLLGVRKIVNGKAIKLGRTAWVVSAALVDVETARTERAESVQHQGDLVHLLSGKMPLLAAALAGSAR
jgi:TolB-like protein